MNPAKRFRTDSYTVHDVVEMDQDPQSIPEPEPRVYIETLSFPYTNIYDELSQNQLNYTDFETLEINNIPTIPDAVNLISSDILRQKFYQTSYSIAIRLRIDDKITTLSPLQYEIISTKIDKTRKFLLCLESLSDKKFCFYWKSRDDMPLMTLSLIDLDIVDRESMGRFVNSFLFLELRLENIGLSEEAKFTSSTELSLFSLADVNDKNLLMLAAELGNCPVVEDLLKIGFDVNFQVDNQIAADLAWQNRHLDVLLSLLLENSLYPMDFNEANTSNEMKEFVKMTHQFVKSVKNNDEITVQNILDKYPNLRYFYSRDNVSAAFVALSKEKFNIYKIFMNKNVCVGPKEDIDKILTKFNDKKREELRKIHLEHSREPPEKFLMILHSNTSVGHDTINVNEKLNHAKLAIEYLCRISIIRLILQVVAASRDFKLIFDFNRDSVQFLDPTSSKQTRGSFFTSRQIYIAAKFLLDPQHRQEAIGTLAHELCHYAMFLVYKNNCLPYFNGDHKMAKTFHGYLKYCHENRKREKIIGYVFDIPKENQETRHAELVVRVPHLLALYHEDQDYLDKLRELYLPLFSFFEFKVVEDMKTALPNIEIEGDDEIKKFNDKRKRKGFCRMRNLVILILIASISVIGITLGVYFRIFFKNDDDLVGDVKQPWNAIIRHSRSDQVMCIGSVIHRDFVLTTAECVHKKHHQNRLPPELFRIEFHPENDDSFKIYVEDISVHPEWKHNQDNLGFDISLLKLARSLTFSENFHPIMLPQQFTELQMTSRNFPQLDYTTIPIETETSIYYSTNFEVLHTMLGSHSFNIPITIIDTIECILDDYTINRFLDVQQYCARQMEINYCINGYGEQLYDDKSNTLHGLVSMGHKSEADCIKNGSLIITDLAYFTDSIKNVICGDVVSSSDSNPWLTRSWVFDFMVAIQEKASNKFLCWSFLVSPNILITDYNCIKNMKIDEFKLSRLGESMPGIYSIDNKAEVNLAKIILASDSVLSRNVEILNFTSLQNVKIVNNFEDANNISTIYYSYPNEINNRIISSFCVQYSGGPIFNDDTATIQYFAIITKEPCDEDNCDIEDNGFKVSYVKLYDYIDWINQKPPETTQTPSAPNTTTPVTNNTTISTQTTTTTRFFTLPSFPTFPSLPTVPSFSTPLPDGIQNSINGEIIQQDYCGSTGCSPIRVFSSTAFQINSPLIPYGIASPPDDQINGFESNVVNKNVKSLPIDVVDIFPNLFIFTFTNTGVNRISFDNFRELRTLEVIALNLNEIESIDSDSFNNTAKLRSLNLSDNKISIFNEFILQPIQNLEIFNIGSNSLKNNVPIFRHCLMLKEVYLFKNEISEIFNNIFANCDNLEIIDLNSNEISFLHRDLFANKTHLSTVDLTGNVCIDRKFQGTNGTKFTTEEYNSLINATNNCNFLQSTTTTFNPTTPSRPPS